MSDSAEIRHPAQSGMWIVLATAPLLALAFLLASVPAGNSDVWRHLATGRALFTGTYKLGVDPFAYTTSDVVWVNHAWLYDAALYVVHLGLGEYLVLANALLAVAIAVLLLLACGWPRNLWSALFSVGLGLICLGPHLTLSPTMMSYLLFACTLWWLDRRDRGAEPAASLRSHLPLLVAFVLWANCDEWFLLGPLTVGLFWLGTLLRSGQVATARHPLQGLTLFLASLAVCLMNPHHVRAFRWPASLGISSRNLDGESGIDRLLAISWPDISPPLVAYVALAVLGLLALLASRWARSWPQVLVWSALLALSLYRSAAMPFFAIVACQLLARQWQAVRERSVSLPAEEAPPARRFAWLAPLGGVAAFTALALLSCPGWLQGSFSPRGWHLNADPSMQRLAQQLAAWHEQGKLGQQSRGFNLSADVAHYVEWHCPQEKVFLDGRANLFPPEVAADFEQIRNVLAAPPSTEQRPADWDEARALLNRWQCTHLLIADPADRRLASTLRNLWQRPQELSAIAIEGRAMMFVLNRPSAGSPPPLPALRLHAQAFDPALARTAPREGLSREPRPQPWWDCFTWSDPGEALLDRDEAIMHIVHFEASRLDYLEHHRAAWREELIADSLATLGTHGSGVPSIAGWSPLEWIDSTQPVNRRASPLDGLFAAIEGHQRAWDQGPPGSLLLAIRAARRSLHANPDDAVAHLRLGRAYQALHQQTLERSLTGSFPLLEQLRKVQAIVALKRAAELRPDLLSAHELLAGVFLESGGFDLALPHVQAQFRLSQAAGPLPNETPEQFAARIERLEQFEQQLGTDVRNRQNLVDTKSFGQNVYSKARLAESHGLPGYALAHLLRSNYAEFGREGAIFQLYLLLHAGRTRDFRMMIDPTQEPVMGTFNYRWMQTLLASVDGDYDEADEQLRLLLAAGADLPAVDVHPAASRAQLAADAGEALVQLLVASPWRPLHSKLYAIVFRPPAGIPVQARHHADLNALRGMLLLETGEIEAAEDALEASLSHWHGPDGSAQLARHFLRLIAGQ